MSYCIDLKVHRIEDTMQSEVDLRGLCALVLIQRFDQMEVNFDKHLFKVNSTQTEINLIQTEVVS